ncbi:MAG: pilus assembly protein [Lachnospiraceae bacterium]|nr:pilus assembly protein [Lachnospiraceae bacterium]
MRREKKQSGNETGMMSVEAVLALVPFLLVILGIISFTNIYMVHNRIQYAMFEAGSQLSAYTYLYQALGIREGDQALGKDIDSNTEKVDAVLDAYETFTDETSLENGKTMVEKAVDFVSDPKEAVANLLYLAIEHGEEALKDYLVGLLGGSLMEVYLDQSYDPYNQMDADTYLKKYGVVDGFSGLSFDNSNFLSDDDYRIIDIVVEYDLEIYFFKLFLKDPTIHVVQRCTIPAWLDGDGEKIQQSR